MLLFSHLRHSKAGTSVLRTSSNLMNRKNKSPLLYFLLLAVIPFSIAVIYYYLFCPDVFFVQIIDYATASLFGFIPRRVSISGALCVFFRNHMLDYIWAQTLSATILYISVVSHRNIKCDFILCITLALLMEFIQLSHYVLLTFDWTDVLVQLLGAFAAFLCLQPFLPNK